jgi:hypothetical protein
MQLEYTGRIAMCAEVQWEAIGLAALHEANRATRKNVTGTDHSIHEVGGLPESRCENDGFEI